ncbi:MAG TPA: DNA recombination protein RmuC [Nitrospiria bacterium]|nr:DNA recombination protein RmuC [Nitrospiria bacterium]
MMEQLILVLLVLLVVGLITFGMLVLRRSAAPLDTGLHLMQQQVDALRAQLQDSFTQQSQLVQQQLGQLTTHVNQQLTTVTKQLQEATGQIGNRLDHTTKVFGEVQNRLGSLTEAAKQVQDVGKEIADLQKILRAPKLRGQMGELFLGDLLLQLLPPAYVSLQHRFKSGEAVDAAIRFSQGLVPIDAKFPLENFKRVIDAPSEEEGRKARKQFAADVRKHIDAIAAKYILPDEGTFDFAMMYIPAENVYYETIIKDEVGNTDKQISGYALSKRVIPVSPNSLYAYLQVILWGLRGLQVEKSARTIMTQLDALKGDVNKFCGLFDIMGTHLTNAGNKYQEASRQLDHFTDKLALAGHGAAQQAPGQAAIAQSDRDADEESARAVQEPLRLA